MSISQTVRIFFIVCFLLIQSDSKAQKLNFFNFFKKNNKKIEKKEKIKSNKPRPDEIFYHQRAYPDQTFDYKAYFNSIAEAQGQAEARSGVQDAFSLPWTLVGPTNIRGRVNTVTVHPTNTDIRLIGFSSGGVWKTIDGGKNWKPVFDNQNTQAIGSIAYSPSNPNIVYVGTGDPNITGYPFIGTGVYKSTDGGETWKHIGLTETRITAKIVVHPTNPDLVYAATMGLPFERNEHRGLYRSSDGGLSWLKVYYFSDQAGCIDIAMNPLNPKEIFISGWDRIRNNKETTTDGPNCRIVKTNDGGDNWTNQVTGLPASGNGRIGLAYSPNQTSTIHAVIMDTNANIKGVYKTTSGGASWTNIVQNLSYTKQFTSGLGWYFGKIYTTATDVYVLGVDLWRTKDNGITWDNLTEGTDAHVDMHDFFIRGNVMYLGSDGGVFTSADDGQTWQSMEQIPSTQHYKVTTHPYGDGIYCGGAQDQGTLLGGKNNINNWKNIQIGDGFRTEFTPLNKKYIFTENQSGSLWVSKDSAKTFQLASFGINNADRRSWDTPYFVSDLKPRNMFIGTDKVYKCNNVLNPVWTVLSQELTKTPTFAPQFHVITCLDESKQDTNKLYVGTSDGRVWTNDKKNPASWINITGTLPDRYVTSIHTSPSNDSTVYVTHSGYKDNLFTPHIHKSTNGGKNWTPIQGNLPLLAVNDFFVLPNHADSILFAATDGGIYTSINRGIFWQRLGSNMPYLPTYDIEWDKKNNLLVAATHGRAIMTYRIDTLISKMPLLLSLSGRISMPLNGKNVRNTIVTATVGTKKFQAVTDSSGVYRFDKVFSVGSKIILEPKKQEKGANGLSGGDMLDIQKHVLGVKKIINTTDMLAADANLSKTISVADIVAIRKLVLAIEDTFPHGKAWRFYPADFQFSNSENPFANPIPENITINSLDSNKTNINFIALRIGDTNESTNPLLNKVKKDKVEGIRRRE